MVSRARVVAFLAVGRRRVASTPDGLVVLDRRLPTAMGATVGDNDPVLQPDRVYKAHAFPGMGQVAVRMLVPGDDYHDCS